MDRIRQYLSSIGARGGISKSRAKSDAAKANGKLGGRPKKPKRITRRRKRESRI